jgi:cysteinyl-tRNA synthetase
MAPQLSLYSTSALRKEIFHPLHDQVGIYCCGPTVYNFAHIGNLRTYIFEDVLVRTLRALDYKVRHIVNITDVGHLTSDADTGDDKMEKGAVREGITVWDIAARYTAAFKNDMAELNIAPPDLWVKATDHIPQMISMVQELERRGFTYTITDGVYFDTAKFPAYRDFARLDVESLRAGSRVEMGEKRCVTDFALWKFSPADKKRQMEWDSPWGRGFPGWHIECSAMALAYLQQPIEIHCGGTDHIRVHHTNEIAQAEAATGKPYVRYWLHGEFLNIDKGKMAKSGENFVTLDSVKKQGIRPVAYRMFCFSAHYRSPLAFSWDGLKAAAQGLEHLKKVVGQETRKPCGSAVETPDTAADKNLEPFFAALCDDFNMPVAMAEVWNLVRDRTMTPEDKYRAVERIETITALDLLKAETGVRIVKEVGEGELVATFIARTEPDAGLIARITAKLKERKRAKQERDFSRADAIRLELVEMGARVRDLPGGKVECTVE